MNVGNNSDEWQIMYKQAYFRAVRRAMLENETIMRLFMDTKAIYYDISKLKELDKLLLKVYDNDLFDLIMGNLSFDYMDTDFDQTILEDIIAVADNLRLGARSC